MVNSNSTQSKGGANGVPEGLDQRVAAMPQASLTPRMKTVYIQVDLPAGQVH